MTVGHHALEPLGERDATEPRVDQRALQAVDLDEANEGFGLLLALELLRALLAVAHAIAHLIGTRTVVQPPLADRGHALSVTARVREKSADAAEPVDTSRQRASPNDQLRSYFWKDVQVTKAPDSL